MQREEEVASGATRAPSPRRFTRGQAIAALAAVVWLAFGIAPATSLAQVTRPTTTTTEFVPTRPTRSTTIPPPTTTTTSAVPPTRPTTTSSTSTTTTTTIPPTRPTTTTTMNTPTDTLTFPVGSPDIATTTSTSSTTTTTIARRPTTTTSTTTTTVVADLFFDPPPPDTGEDPGLGFDPGPDPGEDPSFPGFTSTPTVPPPATVPVPDEPALPEVVVGTQPIGPVIAPVPVPPVPAAPRRIGLNRTTSPPGGPVQVSGNGCDPGAPVSVEIGRQSVSTGVADASGTFTLQADVPSIDVGRHDVTATCGPVLTTFVDVVLSTQVQPVTTTLAVLVFFVLLSFAVIRRQRTGRT